MTADQQEYLRRHVARDIRQQRKGVVKLREKYGEAAERRAAKRLRYIEDVYRSLGGDPATI